MAKSSVTYFMDDPYYAIIITRKVALYVHDPYFSHICICRTCTISFIMAYETDLTEESNTNYELNIISVKINPRRKFTQAEHFIVYAWMDRWRDCDCFWNRRSFLRLNLPDDCDIDFYFSLNNFHEFMKISYLAITLYSARLSERNQTGILNSCNNTYIYIYIYAYDECCCEPLQGI